MNDFESRLNELELAVVDALATACQARAQTAILAQITGGALARAAANTSNPAVILEQLLQLFEASCLEASNQMEKDAVGMGDAQRETVEVVRESAEGVLAGISSRF